MRAKLDKGEAIEIDECRPEQSEKEAHAEQNRIAGTEEGLEQLRSPRTPEGAARAEAAEA